MLAGKVRSRIKIRITSRNPAAARSLLLVIVILILLSTLFHCPAA